MVAVEKLMLHDSVESYPVATAANLEKSLSSGKKKFTEIVY